MARRKKTIVAIAGVGRNRFAIHHAQIRKLAQLKRVG
jgi:hypothetical protein